MNKINKVKSILKDKKVVIAFSGGADSTLMSYLASEVASEALAITINNHLMPYDFLENCEKIANDIGINHLIVDIDFYNNSELIENKPNRCFLCRDLMYSTIRKIAEEKDFDFIVDGNNISDLLQDRPGILITYKNNFVTPFIEAGLTTDEIHDYLNENNIYYSKSTTCVATRIQTNSPITKEKIKKIDELERFVYEHSNCEIVKMRDFNNTLTCEVDDYSSLLSEDKLKLINEEGKNKGYSKVSLNLSPVKDSGNIDLVCEKDNSFQYQLPYNINLENTKKEFKTTVENSSNEKIELKNGITIYKNGLIKSKKFNSEKEAKKEFVELLPNIRREV